MKNEIILIGGGGHCKSCIDVIEQEKSFRIAGIIDVREKLNHMLLGYKTIGLDEDLPEIVKQYDNFLITVGQIKTPSIRIRLFNYMKKLHATMPTIISPLAYVSPHARLGEGTIIMHGAVVNAGAFIGANCIINSKALVEHDAHIGDHCHIATGSLINGGVNIDDETFVGSGSVCNEAIKVGKRVIVSSGTKVKEDIPGKKVVR